MVREEGNETKANERVGVRLVSDAHGVLKWHWLWADVQVGDAAEQGVRWSSATMSAASAGLVAHRKSAKLRG